MQRTLLQKGPLKSNVFSTPRSIIIKKFNLIPVWQNDRHIAKILNKILNSKPKDIQFKAVWTEKENI